MLDPLPPTIALNNDGSLSNKSSYGTVYRSPPPALSRTNRHSASFKPSPVAGVMVNAAASVGEGGPPMERQQQWRQERIDSVINPCLKSLYHLGRFNAQAELEGIEQLLKALRARYHDIVERMAPASANSTEPQVEPAPAGANATEYDESAGRDSSPEL
ncbi:hypothetical protein RhiLY_03478 [Ceratobasidium sp. AG-Ba]|nr:hypothetical protein RhiLY_03478 [Ceratobasidium sp. AG-Ba]